MKRVILISFFFFLTVAGYAQTQISGVINHYAKVTSVDGSDLVTIDNTTNFKPGDTILIVQMKGADFHKDSHIYTGMLTTGRYEFIAIQSITFNQVKFRSNFINNYNANQAVQLVRVPYYKYAKITSTLSCNAWNGQTGGILALMAEDSIEFSADIDVSAKGFRGGNATSGSSICYQFPTQENYLIGASDSAGLKGEGIVDTFYPYKRGRAPSGTGGGGGNGLGSGGGGGAGFGAGGQGGFASSLYCSPITDLYGLGGYSDGNYFGKGKDDDPDYRDRIFMGGGGGAGKGINPGDAINGGNGGGIVFILAPHIKTNSYFIKANGESIIPIATNNASGSGGGGGGSIILSTDKLSGPLNIDAVGGSGGNTGAYCSGQGGGGGGGFLWLSSETIPSGTIQVNGGQTGKSALFPCTSSSTNGTSGGTGYKLNPVLNGFLFNLINSAQTICYGNTPKNITGSMPRGGNGIFTYQWQKKNKSTSYEWIDIPGAEQKDYTPPALTDTTDLRRIVRSTHPVTLLPILDTSKWLTIKVIPEIKNISIDPSDTAICIGQQPITLRGLVAYGGDISKPIEYLWETSPDNSTWATAPSANNQVSYNQTSNQTSFYYRRKVTNGICTVASNASKITVHPLIDNNLITQPQTICYNSSPSQIIGTLPNGGANIYRYKWIKSLNGTSFIDLASADTFQHYTPDRLTESVFYRRIVFSGLRNTCTDTSAMLKITVLPSVINNTIQANQTICEGTKPSAFTGSIPEGGDGSFHYLWETSDNNSNWSALPESNSWNFQNGVLTSDKYFRRIVFSGLNDCCKDTTKANLKVTVQPKILNNTISENQEICNNQSPALLTQKTGIVSGGDGTFNYLWQERVFDNPTWTNSTGTNNSASFQPGTQTKTIYFKRKVTSGTCISLSDSVKINVLPQINENSLSGSTEVCDQLVPAIITGSSVSGGIAGNYRYKWQKTSTNENWTDIPNANQKDYQPEIINQETQFRRIVTSGLNDCCTSTSYPFSIKINPLPASNLQNLDTVICKGEPINVKLSISSGSSPFHINIRSASEEFAKSNLANGINIINISPNNSGIFYTFSVTDSKGCISTNNTGTSAIRVVSVPNANAGISDKVCGPEFNLNAIPSIGTGKWTVPVSAIFTPSDNDPKAKITISQYGRHLLTWKESNEFCYDTANIYITFFEQPQNAEAGENQALNFKFSTGLSALLPSVGSGVWTTNSPAAIADALSPLTQIDNLPFGKNVFTWTVTNGICPSVKDTVVIEVEDLLRFTGFSPNNDGKNDYFVIEGLDYSKTKELKIFNRWGGTVYTSNYYKNDWDGTYKNGQPLPNDTYFYILKADGNRIYKGFFVIKR